MQKNKIYTTSEQTGKSNLLNIKNTGKNITWWKILPLSLSLSQQLQLHTFQHESIHTVRLHTRSITISLIIIDTLTSILFMPAAFPWKTSEGPSNVIEMFHKMHLTKKKKKKNKKPTM
jgi:hypothetical protein